MIRRFSVCLMDYDNVRILCFFLMGGGDGVCFPGILINGQFSGPNIMTISLSMSTTTCQSLSSSPGEKALFLFLVSNLIGCVWCLVISLIRSRTNQETIKIISRKYFCFQVFFIMCVTKKHVCFLTLC